MSSILKELYNGNLCPADHTFPKGGNAKKYKMLTDSQVEIGEQLENFMDAQARKQFDTYRDMQIEINIIEQEELFLYAFRLGAQMMLELLNPHDGAGTADF